MIELVKTVSELGAAILEIVELLALYTLILGIIALLEKQGREAIC